MTKQEVLNLLETIREDIEIQIEKRRIFVIVQESKSYNKEKIDNVYEILQNHCEYCEDWSWDLFYKDFRIDWVYASEFEEIR